MTGHTGSVDAVATAAVNGRPLAVTGGDDATARVWDLTTCKQVGEPLTGHADLVLAVAAAVMEGRPVAVIGEWDGTVRVRDLTTREQVGEALTGHAEPVQSVATAVVDDRPIAITGSGTASLTDLDADNAGIDVDTVGAVRLWDLAGMQQIRPNVFAPLGVRAVDMTSGGRLAVAFGHEIAVLARR
ncbi:hypothetical protein ACFC0C_31750 [Streptomyces sp. NPDC056178]|uniref:hypothetical protein n=1 Tax=Streptomyces sp. NPDC056178 TaxID=3345735 RepID=UPI0035E16854